MASAGPYASLHLAPDRQACQHPATQFLPAGCPSCRPTNSIKTLVHSLSSFMKIHLYFTYMLTAWQKKNKQGTKHPSPPICGGGNCRNDYLLTYLRWSEAVRGSSFASVADCLDAGFSGGERTRRGWQVRPLSTPAAYSFDNCESCALVSYRVILGEQTVKHRLSTHPTARMV